MLRKEKKHEQFPPYSLYRPLQGGLRKSRVLNHPVGLKSSRENLKLRFRPRENVDVFRVRSAPDALLHALWKERSTLSSVSGLNLHLHVFKKTKNIWDFLHLRADSFHHFSIMKWKIWSCSYCFCPPRNISFTLLLFRLSPPPVWQIQKDCFVFL